MNDADVIIVGAGFSGIAVACMLDRAGLGNFLILEASAEVGGTWRQNTYPGCACDIPAPLYSFSFEQVPTWSRLFASQPEILAYLNGVVERRELRSRIRFDTPVCESRWNESEGRWHVQSESGATFTARFLVSAIGVITKATVPVIPGLETFSGPTMHSSVWDHDVALDGKRVAVIGTGASAIQIVPEIIDQVSSLAVFQRTPPWIVPKWDRAFSPRERRRFRWLPGYLSYVRQRLFWIHESRAKGFVADPAELTATAALCRRQLEKQVPDPELRAKLTPDYGLGCKRLLISSDWYPALQKPNATLLTSPIARVTPDAVVAADGSEHPADVIVFGTGFDAQHSLSRVPIIGRDGIELASLWERDMEAYLGTVVHGFPNLFVMTGPNSGLGHNSQVFMIEAQAHYITACLRRMRRRPQATLEVKDNVQRRFNAWVQRRMQATVWQTGGCRSWYMDPVTGRNTLLWPAGTIAFWLRTRRPRLSDFATPNPRRAAGQA